MPHTLPARTPAHPPQALRPHAQGFVPLSLSTERVERLLACLDQHTRATATQLADALGLTCAAARPLIDELCGRGLARPAGGGRRLYKRAQTPVQPRLVLDRLRPIIRGSLRGRPALASGVARDLGEPLDNVAETCKAMHVEGELRGVAVGATFVYSVDPAVIQEGLPDRPDEVATPQPAAPHRGRITEDLVRQVQAALPPVGRRAGGDVERVAERFGLSPSQVYRALKQVLPSGEGSGHGPAGPPRRGGGLHDSDPARDGPALPHHHARRRQTPRPLPCCSNAPTAWNAGHRTRRRPPTWA